MSELFRKLEEAAKMRKSGVRSARRTFPPYIPSLPPSDARWESGLNEIQKLRQQLNQASSKQFARSQVFFCPQCGYEQSYHYSVSKQLYCPLDHSPMMPEFNRELTRIPKRMKHFAQSYAKESKENPAWSAVAGGIRGSIGGGLGGAYVGALHPQSIHAYLSKVSTPISESIDKKVKEIRTTLKSPLKEGESWKSADPAKPFMTGDFSESERKERMKINSEYKENIAKKASTKAHKARVSKAMQLSKLRIAKSSLIGSGLLGSAHAMYGYAKAKSRQSEKQFAQSYAKTPEEEKSNLIKTGIGALGVAAGLTGAGLALRKPVAKEQANEIMRRTVSKIVNARKNYNANKSARDSFASAKAAREKWEKTDAFFKAARTDKASPRNMRQKAAASHQEWKSRNPKPPIPKEPKLFEKKQNNHSIARAATISGAALTGGVLGARTLPRMIGRGRPMREGESLLGKVVYNHQGLTTPAEIIHVGGRSVQSHLHKIAKDPGIKGKFARAAINVDNFLGVPQRHYAVGVGSGRIAEVSKAHGRRVAPQEVLGKKVYVENDGKVLKDPHIGTHQEGKYGTLNSEEVEKFNSRYASEQENPRWKRSNINPASNTNCESYAKGIAGLGFKSGQINAFYGGAAGGALAAGAGAAILTRKKKEFEQATLIREKRDGLSKARDVASLAASGALLGAAGYGAFRAHGLYKQASKHIPKISEKIQQEIPTLGKYSKVALRKATRAAQQVKDSSENVQHSTAAYSDIGKFYKEIKGGLYNILHPKNTWNETKAAFRAGLNGEKAYPTKQRPKWALSAKMKIREFNLRTEEDNIPYNGRVAHDRFIKKLHEDDLDRRDRNIVRAGTTGGLAGLLTSGKNGRFTRGLYGGAAGVGGVMAIRAITNKDRDIYGDRPRWAKKAESAPALAGLGVAGYLAAKKAKMFNALTGAPVNPGVGIPVGSSRHLFEKPFNGYNASRHARTGGLNDKFRKKYNREHGSHLQRPVTKKPSQLKAGSKAAKRRASFCARMKGCKGPTSKDGKLTPKGAALKRWNCESKESITHLFEKKSMSPALKAGLAGAAAGGLIGAIPSLRVGSKLVPSLKSIGTGAAGLGGLVGGGVYVGNKILGDPKDGDGAAYTKRAAIGGGMLGALAGAGLAVASKKYSPASKFIEKYAIGTAENPGWRPAAFIHKASLPAAVAAGTGVGAAIGADKAAEEGQQVDVLNSLQKQKMKQFKAAYIPHDEIADARRQAFGASGIAGTVGALGVGAIGYKLGAKGQFAKDIKLINSARRKASTARVGASHWKDQATKAESRASRAESEARAYRARESSRTNSGGGPRSSYGAPPPRSKPKGESNPHAGTPKAEKWEKWQSMKRGAAEASTEHEREAYRAGAEKWQKKYGLSRKIQKAIKYFSYASQPRRADNRQYADTIRGAAGLEGKLVDGEGRPSDFNHGQFIKGFYNKGRQIHRWGGRASGLASDVGDVFAGRPRSRDAAGRPQKREWEKSWFKNTVGAVTAGAALGGAAYYVRHSPSAQNVLRKYIRKQDQYGVHILAAKLKAKYFDDWAAYNGWDVRDPRGRSARVFAPGSRARYRREKEWHEVKENRDKLHLAVGIAGATAAGVGAAALTRKALGHPVIPDAVSKLFRKPVLTAEEHTARAKFHTEAAKKAAQGNVVAGPWKPRNNPPPKY